MEIEEAALEFENKEVDLTKEEITKVEECFDYLRDVLKKYGTNKLGKIDEANLLALGFYAIPVKPTHYAS